MQFKFLTLAVLATTAVADIKGALDTIATATVQLNKSVTAYSGGLFSLLELVPITTDALCLLNDINAGTRTARASAPLDYEAALDIAGATGTLAQDLNDVIDNLVRIKPKLDQLLVVTPIIKVTLEQERSATQDLCKAVLAKIPTELADVAAILVKQIDDKLAEGVKAFS